MFDFLAPFFTPLDKSYCMFYFILTVISFIGLVLILLNELRMIVFNFKNMTNKRFMLSIVLLFNAVLIYFVNRLLYSICVSSLH